MSDDPQGGGASGRDLSQEMAGLSGMIRDLEDQLDRMISLNDSLKKELEREREVRQAGERTIGELRSRLQRSEQQAAGKENLVAEVDHLNHERSKMANVIRDLEDKLKESEHKRHSQDAMIQRLRSARADALDELKVVETQFERAMRMVTEVRTQLTIASEERDALMGRLRALDGHLAQAEAERDALLAEVDQSRAALDDIRRSLVDVAMSGDQA